MEMYTACEAENHHPARGPDVCPPLTRSLFFPEEWTRPSAALNASAWPVPCARPVLGPLLSTLPSLLQLSGPSFTGLRSSQVFLGSPHSSQPRPLSSASLLAHGCHTSPPNPKGHESSPHTSPKAPAHLLSTFTPHCKGGVTAARAQRLAPCVSA